MAYIWLGRLLMLLALPLLPLSTVAIGRDPGSVLGWGLAVVSFLVYGTGTLISGAPFLALVHDSAPYDRRGQAVSIVQIMLVVSFAFIPATLCGRHACLRSRAVYVARADRHGRRGVLLVRFGCGGGAADAVRIVPRWTQARPACACVPRNVRRNVDGRGWRDATPYSWPLSAFFAFDAGRDARAIRRGRLWPAGRADDPLQCLLGRRCAGGDDRHAVRHPAA